jgi:hypothetical protein
MPTLANRSCHRVSHLPQVHPEILAAAAKTYAVYRCSWSHQRAGGRSHHPAHGTGFAER